jgi:hypothetical protein
MSLQADAALVDVGVWIRSRTVVNTYGEPVGGIVCRVEHQTAADPETGEMTDLVIYRTRDPNDLDPLNVRTFGGADIDPATACPAHPREVGRLVRRVCFEIGRAKNRTGIAKELGGHERTALLDVIAALVAVT